MSPFELVFAVYGLLLGLAIAEVLGGFARALKLKRGTRPIRIGWLTPLLGIVAMLDLTSFWLLAYEARAQISANYLTLICVLAMVGIYYMAASLIFPDEPEEWPDFNDWYDKQNRMVIGGLLTANIASWIGLGIIESITPTPEVPGFVSSALATWIYFISGFSVLGLLIALLKVDGRRKNVAMLATLIVLLIASGISEPYV
ncbi:hypothetical protein [Sphingomonas sp. LT1P40]|uniref:hypothetical protein n=1 Tax=Alteristakelama amylovorans TaxID=3096166 RepID=UPI002FCC946D